ncbi:hypothetical protein C1H46_040611 [Malus baccata]|uniref:Uncharacterized protein n=1 Tax=Malus baccata TaxID=106549 RepID=A0A540KI12_MALBA|nr:hypothetical protein C1H46_040611 [Malus baccata]
MAEKWKREILVVSSQDTGAIIPEIAYPSVVEAFMGILLDFLAPIADQLAIAQPANLVDQLVQKPTVEEPVVHHVIDLQPDAAIIGIRSSFVPVEEVADSATTTPLSNPKTTIALFILDEEDDDAEPSPLVRCIWLSGQPSATSLSPNKSKAVAFSMPVQVGMMSICWLRRSEIVLLRPSSRVQ